MEVYSREDIKDAREGEPRAQIVRRRLRLKKEEPLKRELQHFVQCVRDGHEPEVTGEHGHNALGVAIQIVEQLQGNLENMSELINLQDHAT